MDDLRYFQLTGNVVHSTWFKTIRKENGKADLLAVNILAEIVYWYKPVEVRDEQTGEHRGWRNKYKSDLLQKSYSQLADQFGVSERQVRNAVVRLEELGVITRVFRNIIMPGAILSNVMFIRLNIQCLKELSEGPKEVLVEENPITENRDTSLQKKRPLPPKKETPPSENGETYTEITTKITTKNINTYLPAYTTELKAQQAGHACRADPFTFYKNNFGCSQIPEVIVSSITSFQSHGVTDELICLVLTNTVKRGKQFAYAEGTLKSLVRDKVFTAEAFEASIKSFRNKQQEKSCSNVSKFNNIYSHNWDFAELEEQEEAYIMQKLEELSQKGVGVSG